MHSARGVLAISILFSGLVLAQPVADPRVVVQAFNPKGTVKDVRQVAARFSEPMVAFGDPRLAAPFDIRCGAKGNGHWADARNWVYDFEADLPAGLKCNFSTRAKLTALSGKEVSAASFDFSTGGPAIRDSWPGEGAEDIDEDQVFLLGLDAVADLASVREHAYCSTNGLGERVPLQLIEGKERDQILAEQKGKASDFFLVLTKRARLGLLAVKDKRIEGAPLALVARCGRKLAAGSDVSIVWGAGIRTVSGVATEADQTLRFTVRKDFSAKSRCERANPKAGCIPVLPITLSFTAPVDRKLAAAIELRGADGKVIEPTLEPLANTVESISFKGPFAPRSEVTIKLPSGFQDDAKRPLVNAASFPLKIRIDDDLPLIKFTSHFGILEANAEPVLPVSVRNVEATLKGLQTKVAGSGGSSGDGKLARIDTGDNVSIARWINKVLKPPHQQYGDGMPPREGEKSILFGKKDSDFKATPLTLPRASGSNALELMGIPMPSPGFFVVEFASKKLGQALHAEDKPYYVYSSALVTNMAVHFKLGRESSLAWVTQLDNAKSVKNAKVSVLTCDGDPIWDGETDGNGIVRISEELPRNYSVDACSGLLIVARKDKDMSFTLTEWTNGIEPWQFNLGGDSTIEPVVAHTVFDRPLFRAAETVSMKHFVRVHTSAGFDAVRDDLPATAKLTHNGSGQEYEVPVTWHANAGVSTWAIPKEAKLGSYDVTLALASGTQQSGRFRVEQYRVPLMKAVLKAPAKAQVRATSVDIDAQLSYLSGGAAAGAPVKFRSRLMEHSLSFRDYDDFTFGGKAPKEGIEVVEPYFWDPESDGDSDGDGGNESVDVAGGIAGYPVRTRSVSLDASGGTRINFAGLPKTDEARVLEVEMEYVDPNGQILTSSTRVPVLPSALVLGMRVDGAYATKEKMSFKVLALDPQGKPQAGRKISVDAYQRTTYAYRKRLLGGFYAYEQTAQVKRIGEVCSGKSDARGMLLCVGESSASGELVLVASAKDDDGNVAQASNELYVADGDNWYAASANDRIDVLPERRDYKPGETARFEVRMPFREATALVTVEREGVLYSQVVPISAKSPYISVPIAKNFGPNTYVSVMVVRGRIDPESTRYSWLRRLINRIGVFLGLAEKLPADIDTHPTALVDLTKPAFRMGIAQIRVGWDAYELKVKVTPDKEVYKVRDRAFVNIHVTDAAGKPAANAEIALAAVDEGLLSLAAPTSWKLLEAMMQRRPEEVTTSTAQSQVIGKRHFGKKSAAPGGGGGGAGANARELFDTLLLWNPVVQLDANGKARVEVPLNDSLTAFRIEAVAHANVMQFGSGSASIRTTQEVMLFSGLPPFVREGDQFDASVTVRNGGERPLTLDVNAAMAVDANGAEKPVGTQRISLKPGEAGTLSFAANVPFDANTLHWNIAATEVMMPGAAQAVARDALKFVQKVGAAYPVRVYQQTIEQLEPGKAWSFPVRKPAGAMLGRGGVDVRLVNSLGGNMEGLREWMTRYPYICLEQRASVAVALQDPARWTSTMNSLPSFLDGDGLARYFPMAQLPGDDTLTAYLLAIAHEAGYEIPEASRMRMLRGLENFVAGRVHRYGALQTADVVLRKLAAIDALARYDLAKPAMLETLEIAPNLWPSSGVIDWISVLSRMKDVPDRDRKLAEAQTILRSRLMFSGTTMSFSTEKSDYLWWLMISPDVNSVRALRLLSDDPAFPAADAGRLARGALGRQASGRWSTTVANAWGVLALRHFKARYESDPVNGASSIMLGDQERRLAWNDAVSGNTGDPTLEGKDFRQGESGPVTQGRGMPRQFPAPPLGTPMGAGVATQFAWPAAAAPLTLTHQGGGKPWAFVASRAALPLEKPMFYGYSIKRTVTAIEQKKSGQWHSGDTYRVTLDVDAQSDRTWVVLNDPVPAGATILGSGLGGDSAQLTAGTKNSGWQRPAFEERAFDGFRAYYRYMPKGKLTLEYTVRLNNPGRFEMPATRIEAMYAPEVFGELPVPKMVVVAAGK